MDLGLCSIIIPVYNVEDYLEECLQSILEQTYKNYEVILIDDGSKDRSKEICDQYSKRYGNIKVIHDLVALELVFGKLSDASLE